MKFTCILLEVHKYSQEVDMYFFRCNIYVSLLEVSQHSHIAMWDLQYIYNKWFMEANG